MRAGRETLRTWGPEAAGSAAPAPGRRSGRVWLLTVAMFATALGVAWLAGLATTEHAASPVVPWWVFALVVAVVEYPLIHLQIRRETYSFTLGELGLSCGLIVLPPGQFVLAAVVGALLAKLRLPAGKIAFGVSVWALQAVLAATIFHHLSDPADPFSGQSVSVVFLAMSLVWAVGVGAALGAISLTQGRVAGPAALTAITIAAGANLANTGLGIVTAHLMLHDPQLVPVLVGPIVVLFIAYRAFVVEHQRHQRLQVVYKATRSILQAPEIGEALDAILSQAREVFRADVAQVVLYPDRSDEAIVVRTAGPASDEGTSTNVTGLADTIYHAVTLTRRAELVSRTELDRRGGLVGIVPAATRNVIVAPLEGDRRLVGAIAVATLDGDATPFDDADLELLETLAGHAGVAIGNGRLERTLDDLRGLQSELARRATRDALTGLANREHFSLCLKSALADADRRAVGLVYVDLDDFKRVNDHHGHAVGDRLLTEVAARLASCLRERDVAGRLGGDEFAVLLRGVSGVDQLTRLASRIRTAVERPISCGEVTVDPRVSLGVTLASRDADPDSLLSDGDTAMYYAKRAGKGRSAVYDLAMRDAHSSRAELIAALSRAVEADELLLHYQPIVSLPDRRVVGVEALVRWDRPGWGILEPGAFVPLAAEAGLARGIGEWVIGQACRQVARWNAAGLMAQPLRVAVNLSPEQLGDPQFEQRVVEAARTSGLDPSLISLEITERVLSEDSRPVLDRLESLRRHGVRISLDDFGTGLSSLAALGEAPVDELKIPGVFMRSDDDGEAPGLVDALVTIGRTLKVPTVAESVETEGQIDRLERIGCRFAQGHAFAPAMSADELHAWLVAGGCAQDQRAAGRKPLVRGA